MRLKMIANFVSQGKVVADIGTDHAHLPIYLVKQKKVPKAYAMDIRKGPLSRAKEEIHRYGLEEVIETRLSDGLIGLNKKEAQSVVIAGMGGGLICEILEKRRDLWMETSEFILSPQSELKKVRNYLHKNGFIVQDEEMLIDADKYYLVMKVIYGQAVNEENHTELEDTYGKNLLEKKHPILKQYLEEEYRQKMKVYENLKGKEGEKINLRLQELEDELSLNRKAFIQIDKE